MANQTAWPVAREFMLNGRCIHCGGGVVHRQECIVTASLDREQRDQARESSADPSQFVAAGVAVMQGLERVAVARSHNFAKRIARALNHHKVNSRGY